MKGRKWVLNTYHRLCACFLLVLIPVLLSSYVLYDQGIDIIRKEIIGSLESRNASCSRTLQNEINRILTLQQVLSANWDINRLSLMAEEYSVFELSQAVNNLRDKLWAVQSGSRFIESIDVYIAEIDLNVGTSPSQPMVASQRVLYSALDNYEKNELIYYQGRLTVLTESGYFQSDTHSPAFLTRTTLSSAAIGEFLREQSVSEESGGILYSDTWGLIAASGTPMGSDPLYRALSEGSDRSSYTAVFTRMKAGDLVIASYVSNKAVFSNIRTYQKLLWLFVIVLIVIFLVFSRYTYQLIHTPLNHLVEAFRSVEAGDLTIRIRPGGTGEFSYLYCAFDRMMDRLHESIENAYQLRMLAQNAEYKQLQSQIDPHFLYNSFFILNKRIRCEDTENALLLSESLGTYFQYVTRSGRDTVPLEEEWEHAKNYCHIQQIRFSNRMQTHIDPLPDDCRSIPVPRLILQPICENAIQYAIERSNQRGILVLACRRSGEFLELTAEDNGSVLTDEQIAAMQSKLDGAQSGEVTAIVNIHRRLQLRYGPSCGITIERSSLGGLFVRLLLKLEPPSAKRREEN